MGGREFQDILDTLDSAIERGIVDPNRVGIGGWSQGGFLSAWAVTQTDRFKAAVVGAGVTDWGMLVSTSDSPSFEATLAGGYPWDEKVRAQLDARSPMAYSAACDTPVLLLHGEADGRVPVSQSIAFFRALRGRGTPVNMITYPGEPHEIEDARFQLDIMEKVVDWFDRFV
jgi:dipeptidyl aminopeptidase/acylaminoacyl peptidase